MSKIVVVLYCSVLFMFSLANNESSITSLCSKQTFIGCIEEENTIQFSYEEEKKELKKTGNEDMDGKKQPKWSDDDVDMANFQMPSNFNMEDILYAVASPDGPGWFKLTGMYSKKDIEMAQERVLFHTNTEYYMNKLDLLEDHAENDEIHNNYKGLVWALLLKGHIFEKIAQHPAIINISHAILGQNAQISSFAANTVLPGMKAQIPHLDYPYYRHFLPAENPNILDNLPPLALQFVTMLTEFTVQNGGTAVRPYSHIRPRYPDDPEEFFDNAIQMTGDAGDVVIFAGAAQHCAMPNKSKKYRSGLLQHMAPAYIRPFENIGEYVTAALRERASPALRQILGLNLPYPITKM